MATVTINEKTYTVEILKDETYKVNVDFNTQGTITIFPAKGDKGDQGEPGPANTLTIGAVAQGSSAQATITGTTPNQVLNLTLPKGDKGDKGDKVDTGDTGQAGSQILTTTIAPSSPNYTFTISNLSGNTSVGVKEGDLIVYSYYRYQVTSVGSTTCLAGSRVSIRGATGAASKWYTGTAITGTSTTATIFSGSGISSAVVGDMYLNTSTENVYKCTTAGAPSAAKWAYTTNIKGSDGAAGDDGYSPQITLTQTSTTVATLSITSKNASGQITTQTATFGGTYTDGNGVSY
jgi:hypothetical protein